MKTNPKNPKRRRRLLKLLDKGLTKTEVARHMGITRQGVDQHLMYHTVRGTKGYNK